MEAKDKTTDTERVDKSKPKKDYLEEWKKMVCEKQGQSCEGICSICRYG